MTLAFEERPAAGEPEGLLILHHGRGTDERDLLGLADVLDPDGRLRVVTPRAPLQLPGSPGYHWYVVERVGHPDRATFHPARAALAELHDELWSAGLGPDRTVLGGFSMGTVMSYAMALGEERPHVAGILAFSGFVPVVEDWRPDFGEERRRTRAFIAHGRADPVIEVGFGRRARDLLSEGGLDVDYRESDVAHQIDPRAVAPAARWLGAVLGGAEGERA